jgi:hypothetical protein
MIAKLEQRVLFFIQFWIWIWILFVLQVFCNALW